jgi:haloalkane dehalogenase
VPRLRAGQPARHGLTGSLLRTDDARFRDLPGDSDPGTGGWERIFQERVPGARGRAHEIFPDASHFSQEDRGPELAARNIESAGA